MVKTQSNDVALRLRAIGLQPTVVQTLLSEVEKWVEHNGIQETVKRLKIYKVDFVRLLAGEDLVGGYARKETRLPDGRTMRLPKGVFGYLFRFGYNCWINHRQRDLHRVWNALITYTRFVSPDVTWEQWKKFSTAVRSKPPSESELARANSYVSEGLRSLPKPPAYEGEPKPLIAYQPREGKRRPVFRETVPERRAGIGLEIVSIAREDNSSQVFKELEFFTPELCNVLRGTTAYPRPGNVFAKGDPRRKEIFERVRSWKRPLLAGVIGLIQEPGFKLRAVANPYRVHQLALEPLGTQLFKWLRSVPEDCCFHQESGVFTVQGIMTTQNVTIHSVDLSNATDVFPLTLMLKMFQRLRVPRGVQELLLRVARGKWYLPPTSTVRKADHLIWERGLPLGLYPCFALFSLAHHALVRGICLKLGRRDFPYRILGDDIVIWDDHVAEEYKSVMGEIGCPISMPKTLSSSAVAEFAGRVITPWTILHGLKYGDEPNDNSFLELVKFLGPRTIRILLPKQRKVARFVSELPQPWGYGYNPRGIPYAVRLQQALAWEESAPVKAEQSGIVQIRQVFREFYTSEESSLSRTTIKKMIVTPEDIEQMFSISQRGFSIGGTQVPIELMRGNFLYLIRQEASGEMKGSFSRRMMRSVLEMTSNAHPDHPFNKPLVQSLYERLLRTNQQLSRTV